MDSLYDIMITRVQATDASQACGHAMFGHVRWPSTLVAKRVLDVTRARGDKG